MKQHYLILTLAFILIAVVFFAVTGSMIGKKMSSVVELDKKIKNAQEKLNSARIMDQQLSQFSRIIDNSLTKQKSFAPSEVNTFIKNLADLADQNQIAVLAIFPKEIQSGLHIVEQQYIMEINTTYVQLGQFLSNLEALDNIVKINTLDVVPLTEGDMGGRTNKDNKIAAPKVARYKVALELSVLKVQKEV